MWLILSFINAVAISFEGVLQKKSTLHFNEYIVMWCILAVSSLFYLPLLVMTVLSGHVRFDEAFWVAVILRLIIDSAAFLSSIKALKYTHLSLAVPMLALTPVFLVFVSWAVNHLFPSPVGLLGVLVTVAGVYFLNFDHDTKHLLSPFFAIKQDKGVQYMFLAAFLWSFVVALQKLGIDHSNVTFYTYFFQPVWALLFLPVAFFSNRRAFMSLFKPRKLKILAPLGVLDALQVLAQNAAFALTLPVYVSAIGSTNFLFATFFGKCFFGEKISNKLIPTAIVVIGVVLLAVAQSGS